MTDEPLPEGPAATQPPRARPSTVVLIVIVAIVVLLVLAFIGVGAIGGDPEATASAPVIASHPASPSAPAESASPSGQASDRIGVDWTTAATFPGASVNDVTAGGPGWVAVGAAGPVGCEVCPGYQFYTGMIWTSTDGRTWDPAPVPNAEGSIVIRVTEGPDGLVAISRRDGDASETNELTVHQILLSTDGRSWEPVSEPLFDVPYTVISDLTGGPILVAVGQVTELNNPGRPAIWTSANGRAWEQSFASAEYGFASAIARGGPGWVAVGALDHPVVGQSRSAIPFPATWESDDGAQWSETELPLLATAVGGNANAVLDSHAGLVAIGTGEYEPADLPGPVLGFAGWQASDGFWDPSPVTAEFLEDLGGGFLLYESAEEVFAIGSGCRCGTGQPGRLWTSTDGLAWVQREETPPILYSVIRFGAGLLAAGIEDGEGAILISE